MKVDISGIIRVNGASLELDFEESPIDSRIPAEGYIINSPISFKGTLTNMNGILELEGQLKTGYKSVCYRCLKEIAGHIDIIICDSFVDGKQQLDEIDAYIYEGKLLELDKVFEDNLILNLPMRQVCDPNCKGLCKKCGSNLNEAQCECKEDSNNPQMEILNKFYNN